MTQPSYRIGQQRQGWMWAHFLRHRNLTPREVIAALHTPQQLTTIDPKLQELWRAGASMFQRGKDMP